MRAAAMASNVIQRRGEDALTSDSVTSSISVEDSSLRFTVSSTVDSVLLRADDSDEFATETLSIWIAAGDALCPGSTESTAGG